MTDKKNRPVFLDLRRIRLPVVAVLSIAHRITGVAMCLSIPFVIYLLGLSLRDAQGYAQALAILDSPPVRFLVVTLSWALSHHFLAGIRFLLIDMEIGVERDVARRSARLVNVAGLIVPVLLALVLL
ncbi:MAG: succinate dehydrogenase, cytochrome b556 subunit [Gammaproteobacteria bacterium]|nr:succinate dehydrogenase, cytochrome b556 subunit [Gammaproteobacteria bacterium]